MGGGRRDVEADIRQQLAEHAKLEVRLLRASSATTPDAAIDRLVDRAFGSPERLLDARELLGDEEDQGARALLLRASRRAADPQPPAPPKPFAPPDAPRP
jgi:hypothetical protein